MSNLGSHEKRCYEQYDNSTGKTRIKCDYCETTFSDSYSRGRRRHMMKCPVSITFFPSVESNVAAQNAIYPCYIKTRQI